MISLDKNDSIILDASCIIIFYASGYFESIIRSLNQKCKIALYVYKHEALTIYNSKIKAKELIQLAPFIENKLIEIVSPDEDELESMLYFVNLNLDDGEAYTIAIGKNRNWYIATDDKAAKNKLASLNYLKIIDTPMVIKDWFETFKIKQDDLFMCLQNIEQNGKFKPSKTHDLENWWRTNSNV